MTEAKPTLNELLDELDFDLGIQHEIHEISKQWWTDLETCKPLKRCVYDIFNLIDSELSEAFEGYRKDLMDDHLPQYKMFDVEIADCLIRVLDLASGDNLDLREAYERGSTFTLKTTCSQNKSEQIRRLHRYVASTFDDYEDQKTVGGEPPLPFLSGKAVEMLYLVKVILLTCFTYGIPINQICRDKMEYNKTRADHQIENRKKAGGKRI